MNFDKIRLVSTDFDGTLWDENGQPPVGIEALKLIGDLQTSGAGWVINTGRSLDYMIEGIEASRMETFPDYVVICEREVYRRVGSGYQEWEEFEDWNQKCGEVHHVLFQHAQEILEKLRTFVGDLTGTQMIFEKFMTAELITGTEGQMEQVVEFVEEHRTHLPELAYQRHGIYLRFCHQDYHKGTALKGLQEYLGIKVENTFTVGDNHNDAGMLRKEYAGMIACPSNAIPEIKQLVLGEGGIVTEQRMSAGVVEALKHYLGA